MQTTRFSLVLVAALSGCDLAAELSNEQQLGSNLDSTQTPDGGAGDGDGTTCGGDATTDGGDGATDGGDGTTDGGDGTTDGGDGTTDGGNGCQPDSDAVLCAAQFKNCGITRAVDNCGTTRLALCGQCQGSSEVPLVWETPGRINCVYNGYEEGNPNSPYAFTGWYQPFGFDALLTPTGNAPSYLLSSPIFWRAKIYTRLFSFVGPASADVFDAVGVGPTPTIIRKGAALRLGDEVAVDVYNMGGGYLYGEPGNPHLLLYSRCYGREKLVPQTDKEFCESYGYRCSMLEATDNTGRLRTASCGSCGKYFCVPETYRSTTNEASWPGRECDYTCNQESDDHFCRRLGKNCDVVTARDECDALRTVNCGTCTSPTTCGADGKPNVCGGAPGITCTTGRIYTPPVGNLPGQCPLPGNAPQDGGVVIDGTNTFTNMTFTWNGRMAYEFNAGVHSPAWGGDLKLYLYHANSTGVDWTEGEGMSGSREGNVIKVNGYFQRSSPMSCKNSQIYTECAGTGTFLMDP